MAGIKNIPAIVKELTDDEATILMVDSNLHRENILPSERAFALKMKMQACNNQRFRSDLTSGQKVQKLKKEKVEENEGISGRQIRRYIRLTELNRELLDLVDKGKIPLTAANELSILDEETQDWTCRAICANKGKLSIKKAKALRKAFETGKLDPVKACKYREKRRKLARLYYNGEFDSPHCATANGRPIYAVPTALLGNYIGFITDFNRYRVKIASCLHKRAHIW